MWVFSRDEIRQERGRASRQEQRANDLENVVKNIKSKICQLEDETIAKVCQQQNQVRELQKDQQISQVIQIVLSEDSNFCLIFKSSKSIYIDQNKRESWVIELVHCL